MSASSFFDLKRLLSRITYFFKVTLWKKPSTKMQLLFFSIIQRVYLTIKFFVEQKMHYRASALSFELLLAIVPILAIIFAVAKGFGLQSFLEGKIQAAFASQPEMVTTLLNFTERYLSRVQGGVFLGVGIIMLLYTLFSLTQSIELAFNDVWKLKESRSFGRKVVDYIAVFFILPIFLVVSSGISIFLSSFINSLPDFYLLNSSLRFLLELLPYLLMIICCTSLYLFFPNTNVKFRSAFIAGVFSGIVIQVLIFLYIHSQVYLTGYNAIYGSFAALPLIMLWSKFIWITLLFGCTFSYVDHNINMFQKGIDYQNVSMPLLDFISLRLIYRIALRLYNKQTAPSIEDLSTNLDFPYNLVLKQLLLLEEAKLIEAAQPAGTTTMRYYLKVPIDLLTPSYVFNALYKVGSNSFSQKLSNSYLSFYYAYSSTSFGQTKLLELDELQ